MRASSERLLGRAPQLPEGYLCFKLFYIAGIAWDRHRFGETNLAGLAELIVDIPVGIVCGFVILVAMQLWMEHEGQRSSELGSRLAAALGLLAALPPARDAPLWRRTWPEFI